MKSIYKCIIFALVITSCSDEPQTADTNSQPVTKVAEKPTPPELEKKFDNIIEEYERRISKDFWSEFTSTTRRGGEGTTEITFDATAFENFMAKKGFTKVPKTMTDFTGMINGVEVFITDRGATSGEHGGWIQNWSIQTKAITDSGTFEKVKDFSFQKE